MALRAANSHEDALAGRSPRAHACRVDTHVDAFLDRVFKGVPMALRAAKGDESRVEQCGMLLYSAGGRGRYRSGSVEAVTEFGPEHA